MFNSFIIATVLAFTSLANAAKTSFCPIETKLFVYQSMAVNPGQFVSLRSYLLDVDILGDVTLSASQRAVDGSTNFENTVSLKVFETSGSAMTTHMKIQGNSRNCKQLRSVL